MFSVQCSGSEDLASPTQVEWSVSVDKSPVPGGAAEGKSQSGRNRTAVPRQLRFSDFATLER